MSRLVVMVGCCLMLVGCPRTADQPVDPVPATQSIPPLAEASDEVLSNPPIEWFERPPIAVDRGGIAVVRVDPAAFVIDVHEDADPTKWETSAALARRLDAVAAINGGFFDPKDRGLGLTISNGVELRPWRAVDWDTFYVSGHRAGIASLDEWPPAAPVTAALQCGPRLVSGGQPAVLSDPEVARRSAVGIDEAGHVLLVAVRTPGMTLSELAAWLAAPAGLAGAGAVEAINLDGGLSTQLSVPGFVFVPGGTAVPNHIVVRTISNPG